MDSIHFISLEDVLYFFKEEMNIAGSSSGIRDQFELEACIESPKHTFDGKYLNDIFGMAVKYVVSFSIRHPFLDGNKRMAAICAVVFLEANGYDYRENEDGELAEIILKFLRKEIVEEDLRQYFMENSKANNYQKE